MDAAKKAVEDAAKMASDAGVAACDKVEKTTGINTDKVEKTVVEGCETAKDEVTAMGEKLFGGAAQK